MQIILQHFSTTVPDLKVYRWILLLGAFLTPLYGFAVSYYAPDFEDPMTQRLLVSVYWLFMFGLSFSHPKIKAYFTFFAYTAFYLLILWGLWVVYEARFDTAVFIGFFVTFCGMSVLLKRRSHLIIYCISITALTAWAMQALPQTDIPIIIAIFCMSSISLVFFIAIQQDLYIQKQLKILNQHLEDRVAEKTQLLSQKNDELLEKNKELEQFAYIASHDLRTPLRAIASFVQLIERKIQGSPLHKDQDLNDYMDFVVQGVQNMNSIIHDLLQYSRFSHNPIELEAVNLQQMLDSLVHRFRHILQEKNAKIYIEEPLPAHLVGVANQLEQLFQNLIENGLKFNTSSQPLVQISAEEHPDYWVFKVQDNGIGIKPDYREKIFEMFKRLHDQKSFSGTGIGLAICKRIALNHEGDIWVESSLGQGAIFFIKINKLTTPKNAPKAIPIATN